MKKVSKFILSVLLMFSCILPMGITQILAEETDYVLIDDNETDKAGSHYFTYSAGTDYDGATGWSSQANNKITSANHQTELRSQHWVWNNDGTAKNHTYSFTFVGTGATLIGIKNDATNNFKLDDGIMETKNIPGAQGSEQVLYEVKNLSFGSHTISVSLTSGTGLQISYAKVFGAEAATVKETITPDMQDGANNVFHFTAYEGKAWATSANEAYIDLGASDANAEQCYYEIPFVGNKIEITATTAPAHGKVKFTVDGGNEKVVDLYASSRTDAKVYTVSGLAEEAHILKATTLNSKSGSKLVNQVVKANVYHEPYILQSIEVEPTLTLVQDASHTIKVKAIPEYAPMNNLKFESIDTSVIQADSKGKLTALKEGTTKVMVSADGVQNKEITVTVVPQVKQIGGSIVDENLQYTQDTYEKVKSMGTIEKTLNAWQNDQAISEIAIIAKDSSLDNVVVETSDFKNDLHTITSDHVSATFVKSVQAWTGMQWSGSYPIGNRAESSDVLYTTEPVDMAFKQVQPIWVNIDIPKGTPAGTYSGTVKVRADGINAEDALTFKFNIKVSNVMLPDASEFKDGFDIELWQYPYNSAEYYDVEPFSEKHLQILTSIMEKYKSIGGHAITATISEDAWNGQTYSKNSIHYPSMVKWIQNTDGSFTYDFTDFDKWIQFNKDLGIGDKIVLYSIAPWSNSFTYWVDGKMKKEAYQVGSQRYTALWTDFFKKMVVHLDEKDWFDDAFVGIDERGLSKVAFDLLDTISNKDGKKIKTAGAMDGINSNAEHRELARRITDLNVGDTVVQDNKAVFDQLLTDRNASGLRTTLYSCTGHIPGNFSLSAPAENYWSMMFAYKNGAKGFLRWAYDAWVEDPLRDTTHQLFEAGDCFQIFPDEKNAENPTAKSSIRLEKMAQGVRDVNKLMMMVKEFPSLQTDIDTLMATLKTRYASGKYYLTSDGKQDIANDMTMLSNGIADITDKYLDLKGTNIDLTGLAKAIKEAKYEIENEDQYTISSFTEFSKMYHHAIAVSEKVNVTAAEIDAAIANLVTATTALKLKAQEWLITQLADHVATYKALEANYTAEEFAGMKKAITEAEVILARDLNDVSDTEAGTADINMILAHAKLNDLEEWEVLITNLKEVVAIANNVLVDDSITNTRPGQVKALQNAVKAAQKLIDDASTDRVAIKKSINAVTKATMELWDIANKDALNKLIKAAEGLTGNYTEDSKKALTDAIKEAKDVAANDDATEVEVGAAYRKLSEAMDNLVVVANKDALATQIEISDKVLANSSIYIPSTIKGLQAILDRAKAVYDNLAATQAEVNAITSELTQANMKVRTKADKSALADAIAKANSYDFEKYTEASVMKLKGALSNADIVMSNDAATEEEISFAVESVDKAISELIKKPATPDTPKDPAPGKPGTGNNTTSPNTGDETTYGGVMAIMALAGCAILAVARKKAERE